MEWLATWKDYDLGQREFKDIGAFYKMYMTFTVKRICWLINLFL